MNLYNSRIPIYVQVIDKIKQQLVLSELSPGDKLPSSRELSRIYNINPNTASRVYREMEHIGLCYTKRGLGTFVTEDKKMVKSIKMDMANNHIDEYIDAMNALGFSKDEMINLIIQKKKIII